MLVSGGNEPSREALRRTLQEAGYEASHAPGPHNGHLTVLADGPVTLAGRTLEDIERQALLDTLRACRGNKAATARSLGVCEKTIYNKLKRLGLARRGLQEQMV
ncbi:MAG: hypothetical protein OER88_02940 [Planctomycetota bacterium]|nr:hypothetical protein [Planctomycetota bacterium]